MKKNTLTFAQIVSLLIILFGITYHAWVTYMSFHNSVINSMILEIKGDVNIWMTSAIAYAIGTTVGSQKKDETIKQALASTPPITTQTETA